MAFKNMRNLPEYSPPMELRDRHPTGDCHCRRFVPSGRMYMGWPACRLCYKLPRRMP